ncbi:MAG: hypothetical protein ABW223_10810, partial [Rariglobus sp.]
LGVLAIDQAGTPSTCGVCAGALEPMGYVYRAVKGGGDCPCDYRCTGALGPSCNCRCEGANHGSGLVVGLEGLTARPVDHVEAASRATEWKSSVKEFEEVAALLPFGKALRAASVLRFARGCRTHRQRMAALRDFIAGVADAGPEVFELNLQEVSS